MIPTADFRDIYPLKASKWLKIPFLLTKEEMGQLLKNLNAPYLAPLVGVIPNGEELISNEKWLEIYNDYVDSLQTEPNPHRSLTCALSLQLEDLRAQPVTGGSLIRIVKPVIQIQPYTLHYSEVNQQFHDMTHSLENLYWGIVFSYPQLYQDPLTQEVIKVDEKHFANTSLFKKIQKWSREFTIPTPFKVNDKVIHVPARLGKQMGAKASSFPQLYKRGISLCLPK